MQTSLKFVCSFDRRSSWLYTACVIMFGLHINANQKKKLFLDKKEKRTKSLLLLSLRFGASPSLYWLALPSSVIKFAWHPRPHGCFAASFPCWYSRTGTRWWPGRNDSRRPQSRELWWMPRKSTARPLTTSYSETAEPYRVSTTLLDHDWRDT